MKLKIYRVESIHTTGNPKYGTYKAIVVAESLEKALETYKAEYKGPIVRRVTKIDLSGGDDVLIQKGV